PAVGPAEERDELVTRAAGESADRFDPGRPQLRLRLRSDADQGAYGQRREERGFGARGHDAKVVGALLGSLARHLGDQWRGGEPERDGDARLGQNTGPQRQGRLGTEPGPLGGLDREVEAIAVEEQVTRCGVSHVRVPSPEAFCRAEDTAAGGSSTMAYSLVESRQLDDRGDSV